jgi:hypothetical protein
VTLLLHLLTAGYGTSRTSQDVRLESVNRTKADLLGSLHVAGSRGAFSWLMRPRYLVCPTGGNQSCAGWRYS